MPEYMNQINKRETKKLVMKKLDYLKLVVNANSYNEYKNLRTDGELLAAIKSDAFRIALEENRIDKKTILDYMPAYTRSIVSPPTGSIAKNSHELKLLDAIAKKDHFDSSTLAKKSYIQWLLDGISRLEEQERILIVDKYLFKLNQRTITERHGISDRTISRILNQAYFNLAITWNCEVFKK